MKAANPIANELKAYQDTYNEIRATEIKINELVNQENCLIAAVKEAENVVSLKPSIGASVAEIKAIVEKKLSSERELELMHSTINELHRYLNMERAMLQDKRDMNRFIISDCWQKLASHFINENNDILSKILYCLGRVRGFNPQELHNVLLESVQFNENIGVKLVKEFEVPL